MISVKHRFHGRGSLRYVYQNGRTVRGPLFAVKAVEHPKRDTYRVAVVVSRKVSKSAVTRNLIRRRLYAGVRQLETDIIRPFDIVLTVFHSTVAQEPAVKLQQQLQDQLKTASVLAKRVQR